MIHEAIGVIFICRFGFMVFRVGFGFWEIGKKIPDWVETRSGGLPTMIVVSGIWRLNGHRRVLAEAMELLRTRVQNCFAVGDWMGDFTSGAFAGFSSGLVLMPSCLNEVE